MKTAAKRGLFLLVMLGGLVLSGYLLYTVFRHPFLYVDLHAMDLMKWVFVGLTLLLWIGAAFCFVFVMYHADTKLLSLLLPMLVCLVLLLLGTLLLRMASDRVLCSYTTDVLNAKQSYAEDARILQAEDYYPGDENGKLTAYAYYECGDCAGEERTVSYNDTEFPAVLRRIEGLGFWKSETSTEQLYERELNDGAMVQIRVDPRTQTVVYGRYVRRSELPEFAPHPLSPTL